MYLLRKYLLRKYFLQITILCQAGLRNDLVRKDFLSKDLLRMLPCTHLSTLFLPSAHSKAVSRKPRNHFLSARTLEVLVRFAFVKLTMFALFRSAFASVPNNSVCSDCFKFDPWSGTILRISFLSKSFLSKSFLQSPIFWS
jgi:hypothetical protein